MKKLIVLFIALLMLFAASSLTYGCYTSTVNSLPFDGFGARADAMGGAFTAVADDGFAPYWNPAGITQVKFLAITADLGAIPNSNAYGDTNITSIKLAGGITTPGLAGNIFAKIYEGPDGNGLSTHQVRTDTILTAATTLFGSFISIGGNFKYTTASYYYFVDNFSDGGQGGAMSYDIGLLIKPTDFISVGFAGHDLNATSVEITGVDSVTTVNFYDSYSFGIAVKPSKSTIVAADLDIINNSKTLRLGFEQTALWEFLALRAGMIKPLTADATPSKVNVGVGLKLLGLFVNAAALGVNDRDTASLEVSAGFKY